MKRSTDRILTTHVGSLPRPADLVPLMRSVDRGEPYDEKARAAQVKQAVKDVVNKQIEHGLDIINDGEMGKPGFINYANERLGGFERAASSGKAQWAGTRETIAFPEFYGLASGASEDKRLRMVCTGPISYKGHDQIRADIEILKAALLEGKVAEAFLPAASPNMLANFQRNAYYKSDEEFLFAIADGMREEYRAIVEAGFLVQIDDPGILGHYMRNPGIRLDDWRKWAEVRVEAINYSLRGISAERVRYHTCHGINMGPRVHDMPLENYVELMLKVNAGGYSFEAANPRHEHEWRVWESVKLPEGKILIPGVITQSTVLVEHPQLVADRIERFANLVGRENVIASADCGFASSAMSDEIHPTVVWAKFKSLAEGAQIATSRLYRR